MEGTRDPTVHLELELCFEAETLSGSLRSDDGMTRSFRGWFELMAALEALRPEPPMERADGGT